MSGYNKAIIIGRLTADPEMVYSQQGKAITKCRLAVNRAYSKDKDHPEADFIPIVLFDKRAEAFAQYSKKGDERLIEGRIQTRTYTAKDGSKGYAWEVVATDWSFQGSKRDQTTTDSPPPSSTTDPGDVGMSDLGMTDDVPF